MSTEAVVRDTLAVDPTAYGVFVSAAPGQVTRTFRDGENLVIELTDGSLLVLHRYFALVRPPAVLVREIATAEVLVLKVKEDGEFIGFEPVAGIPAEETFSVVEEPVYEEQNAGREPYPFHSSGEWLAGIAFAAIAASFVLRDDDDDEGEGAGTPTSAELDASEADSPTLVQQLTLAMQDASETPSARSVAAESPLGELAGEDLQALAKYVNDYVRNAGNDHSIDATAFVDGNKVMMRIDTDSDGISDSVVEVEFSQTPGHVEEWAYGDASAV